MRDFIDTIFDPVLGWLTSIQSNLSGLSVPLSRPIDFGNYFGYFNVLGPTWQTFITTVCALAFIYLFTYIIVANLGLLTKFKDAVKWW